MSSGVKEVTFCLTFANFPLLSSQEDYHFSIRYLFYGFQSRLLDPCSVYPHLRSVRKGSYLSWEWNGNLPISYHGWK